MVANKQNKLQTALAVIVASVAVIIFGLWYLNDQVYLKPENVFWSAIDRSMQTAFVTQSFGADSPERAPVIKEVTDFQFKGQLASKTVVTLVSSPSDKIVNETVGTPSKDFLKYNQITTAGTDIPDNIINVWSVKEGTQSDPAQIFVSQLSITPIIMGYLSHTQRDSLVYELKNTKSIDVDWESVNTLGEYRGKKTYVYQATINLNTYIPIYKQFLAMINQSSMLENIDTPSGSYSATISIDPVAKHVVKIDTDQLPFPVEFTNYDVNMPIAIPEANISIDELQSRLPE